MVQPNLPNQDFWDDFATNDWEIRPRHLPQLFSAPFLTPEELFEAITTKSSLAASDRFWLGSSGDEPFQLLSYQHFGPRAADSDLDGFFTRAIKGVQNRPIGVNVHGLQTSSPTLWFRFRELARELNKRTGLPSQRWDIDTFLGTYLATPFGIHQDNASVFALGIQGQRTYLAWPSDYFSPDDPDLHSPDPKLVEKHASNAIRMDIGPGDVAYWPSSYWHVVVSNGKPSVVVQLSAYFGDSLSAIGGRLFSEGLADHLKNDEVLRYSPSGPELPKELKELASAAQFAGSDFARRLQRFWLRRASADGFLEVPPILGLEQSRHPLSSCLFRQSGVCWGPGIPGRLMVACNGHIFSEIDTPALRCLLEKLGENSEESYEILAEKAEMPGATAKAFFNELCCRRAFGPEK